MKILKKTNFLIFRLFLLWWVSLLLKKNMLSYIKWHIKNIDLTSVIVLPESWVWYEIIINELIYAQIFDKQEVELYVYHNISENGQTLFWFINFEERVLFKELIKISWVWWRVAQNILSLGTTRLKKAILEDDKKTIESVKWVGKKMAEKIVLELADKDIITHFISETMTTKKSSNTPQIKRDLRSEILSTLTMMWYNSKKVEDILDDLPEWYESVEKIIPYVIKNI